MPGGQEPDGGPAPREAGGLTVRIVGWAEFRTMLQGTVFRVKDDRHPDRGALRVLDKIWFWPKAAGPLRSGAAEKADELLPTRCGRQRAVRWTLKAALLDRLAGEAVDVRYRRGCGLHADDLGLRSHGGQPDIASFHPDLSMRRGIEGG